MERKIKIGLAIIILVIFFVPLLGQYIMPINEQPLKGSFKENTQPLFNQKKWFNAAFQEEYNQHFNDSFSYRNTFVRTYNQLQYSLFNKTTVKDVEIGKNNYLYEGGYIRDYMGYAFIGEGKITAKLQKIKTIQDELKEHNTNLIIAFAPGKASYYPEYFPERYDTSEKTISNYQYYSQKCKELNIDYIDFNKLFMLHKQKSKHPIFPKGGVHWGEYGVVLALDELSSFVKKEKGINMPKLSVTEVVYYDTLKESDRDISDAMNLLIEPNYYKMPTPKWTLSKNEKNAKPKLLIIGDSYGYGLTNSPLINELYSKLEFWYYNKEIKPRRNNHSSLVADINVEEELKAFDVVLLLSTETNLFKFDFGFTESYQNTDKYQYEAEIRKVIANIKNNKEWFVQVKDQAKEKGISVNESLRKNAIFVIENRK